MNQNRLNPYFTGLSILIKDIIELGIPAIKVSILILLDYLFLLLEIIMEEQE